MSPFASPLCTNLRETLWTNRCEVVTPAAQTRARRGGNVTAEGGGTTNPTLEGGGIRFSREPETRGGVCV
jgi:hypothetical protein